MKVHITELTAAENQGVGWGAKVVAEQYQIGSGVPVEYVGSVHPGEAPDVWLVSLAYPGEAWRIRTFFEDVVGESMDRTKRSGRTVFILGGHAIVSTRQYLDCFDAVFTGEADDAAVQLGRAGKDLNALAAIPGVDVAGDRDVWFQVATDLSKRGMYRANVTGEDDGDTTVGPTRYLEVARGCKAGCRFCELGWMYGYNERTEQEVADIIASEGGDARDVVLSAPDTDGVSWLGDAISSARYVPRWRSTRVLPYLRSDVAKPNGRHGRIRFGVEGITERLRKLTGKYMSNAQIEEAILRAKSEGYRMFRVFLMCGLPTETRYDRMAVEDLLDIYRRASLRHWKSADIKITPLSPQPFTPWQRMGLADSVEAVNQLRAIHRAKQSDPMWRSVYVGADSTETDVVKRMCRGELIAYLMARPKGDALANVPAHVRWTKVREWAIAAGIDYDARVMQPMGIGDELPWHYIRHPFERRSIAGEMTWQRQVGISAS